MDGTPKLVVIMVVIMVFIMENPIQMDGYYGGSYNEINGGTPKNPNSWMVCKWKILFFNR
jgi:hypothetical protein